MWGLVARRLAFFLARVARVIPNRGETLRVQVVNTSGRRVDIQQLQSGWSDPAHSLIARPLCVLIRDTEPGASSTARVSASMRSLHRGSAALAISSACTGVQHLNLHALLILVVRVVD